AETASVSGATYATEVIIKMSAARSIPRAAYPCGCRYCKDLARAARDTHASPLSAIDVFDLPDGSVESPSAYFH
ncbi:MAG TPA: hypothetical protein VLQ90_10525, partial [Pyrinomonadaceae bacterium]|nr:hypothetical protein [Pyrinomonadaceae bacterium]